jgi:hypothetical protein
MVSMAGVLALSGQYGVQSDVSSRLSAATSVRCKLTI